MILWMNEKAKTVHEVAKWTGITARTLHYYDEIGLLKPSIITEAKYRQYTDDDLTRLQEILFFREVGFALKEIKELLDSPHYVRSEALERHVLILEAQKERIEALISLVKDTINGNKEIKFSAFSNAKILELQSQFQEEVLEQWGNTESFREYKTMFSSHSKQIQEKEIESFYSMARNIFEKLAMYENSPAESSEVQAIVHEWQQYISEHFYECNKQILSNLGVLYITDERFTTFINRFSSGNLAAFLMKQYNFFCRGSEWRWWSGLFVLYATIKQGLKYEKIHS